ncbi:MAG: heme ABC transporter ATP-binding protein [Hydrogenophaga sp.]|uniref:heme ABC transporter ATP-binding protein n=1 Tax=Hydrogenophaga sp. TaxID=1904254 RepID=UPI0026326D3C|nr:heme ABC transporter ATP-binding protein [Hydrogenophaga sp.]MDM7941399.1 heme ABC transporter ATP-binding protein [Hydrogenophaga sp.]
MSGSVRPSALMVSGLRVSRGGGDLVLIDDLRIAPGEFVAIIGPNGAGKSSVLKAVTGEWESVGAITLLGRSLSEWKRGDLARRMAVMPQSSQLAFDFTVREVVAMGRLPHRGESIHTAVRVVNETLSALALDEFSHRRFTTLSGGERQRVQFARVLAQIWDEPSDRLLLLDEPTSALDLAQQKAVLDHAWHQSRQGATVVAVMHDLNMVSRYADRVLVFSNGRLVKDAPPVEVLTEVGIQSVFGLRVGVERSISDGLPIVLMAPPLATEKVWHG